MSQDIIHWPYDLLAPQKTLVQTTPFSRVGGRSLGGITRPTRSDRGFHRIRLEGVGLKSPEERRTWGAIDAILSGMAGLIAVPAWSHDTAPYDLDNYTKVPRIVTTTHDDDTTFDDGSSYSQGQIDMEMATFAPLGATVVTIRIIAGAPRPSGIRFSYQYALYRTGRVLSQINDNTWQVELSTSVRAPIPTGAKLEADRPTCLCRLANDDGMSLEFSGFRPDFASVEFVEAVDVWNDIAIGAA